MLYQKQILHAWLALTATWQKPRCGNRQVAERYQQP